jgi:uncharacterized protein (DUF4415 family)
VLSVRERRLRENGNCMKKKPNPTLTDRDNPPLTAEMFKRARPAREVFEELGLRYPGQRGPQKAPTKAQVTLRLDREVVDHLRASGPGWQTRANDILRRSMLKSASTTRRSTRTRRISGPR